MFSLPSAPPAIGSSSWNKTAWKEGHRSEDRDQVHTRDKRLGFLKTFFDVSLIGAAHTKHMENGEPAARIHIGWASPQLWEGHECKRCKKLKETTEDDCKEEAAVHGEQWLLLKRLAGAADLS